MPHELELPELDLSPFLTNPGDSSTALRRRDTAANLDRYLTSYGFLYITGFDSVVSQQELDAVLEAARAFFARPEAEKAKLKTQRGDGARGWQKMGENVTGGYSDWHEGWDCYKPFPPEEEDPSKLLRGPNRWPTEPSNFRPLLETHFKKMEVLGHALMEATAMALGIEEGEEDYARLKGWVSDPFWVARCIGYPPLPADAKGVSCGAHKDYGNWTLLLADPTPGALQVFLRDPEGSQTADDSSNEHGYWINADPKPGCLVVNVGEMVEVYSAGRYKATLHRVIHKAPTYRVSVPFFFEPNFDATITPLAAASRAGANNENGQAANTPVKQIKPVNYGAFLAAKVASNFALEDS
ncbi:hypothetical protein JCM10908_005354 [Rhodotorula pacifica]|uniref:isopenicillin N synthase family dioxygenase n=1 Tax=Rhodotorula pacifica TaxID=1495444 RepID=UPI00317347E8